MNEPLAAYRYSTGVPWIVSWGYTEVKNVIYPVLGLFVDILEVRRHYLRTLGFRIAKEVENHCFGCFLIYIPLKVQIYPFRLC